MPSLKIVNGLEEGQEGFLTQQRLLAVFEAAINLQQRKAQTYGDAFRSQGYMGNVARVLSKASRLKKMVWTDLGSQREDAEEPVRDTLLDLINLAGFTIINMMDNNKWGDRL